MLNPFGHLNPAFIANLRRVAGGGGPADLNPETEILSSNLQLWLDASQESHSDLDADETFTNWTSHGSGRNYAAVDGSTYRTGITPQGTAVMRYSAGAGITGHTDVYDLSVSAITTASEIFLVLANQVTGTLGGGPFRSGTSGSAAFYPFASNHYTDFCNTTRDNYLIDWTDTDFHVMNMESSSGNFTVRINGVQKHTNATNTFGMATTTVFGSGVSGQGFDGDIAEVLWYDGVLSTDDRALVEAYLQAKHIA